MLAELVMLLLEVDVRAADEGVGFPELLSDVGLVLRVPTFDEDGKALGHKLYLVAEPFDKHACVALEFIKPPINRNKTLIN